MRWLEWSLFAVCLVISVWQVMYGEIIVGIAGLASCVVILWVYDKDASE